LRWFSAVEKRGMVEEDGERGGSIGENLESKEEETRALPIFF
jgi:hypothetical protein